MGADELKTQLIIRKNKKKIERDPKQNAALNIVRPSPKPQPINAEARLKFSPKNLFGPTLIHSTQAIAQNFSKRKRPTAFFHVCQNLAGPA
jgi:hypothetical protein